MRTLILLAVLGAVGVSPFLLGGTAEAQDRSWGTPPDRCVEVIQDEIEGLQLEGPIVDLPPGILKMGLECYSARFRLARVIPPGQMDVAVEAVVVQVRMQDGFHQD